MLSWILDRDERRALVRYRAVAAGRASARDVGDRDKLRARWASTGSRMDVRAAAAYLDRVVDRELGLTVHDGQWVAVLALLDGRAVQLDTGEGKTLVGALAATLEAWRGRQVHVATVNDYLAERDAAWMAPVLRAAGVSVAAVTSTATAEARRAAYGADVVYGSLTQIGFDTLCDGLVEKHEDRVLGGRRDHLIVDEVDALLVDHARIPLVIAGPWGVGEDDLGARAAAVVATLEAGFDFEVDDAQTAVWLTDRGIDAVEGAMHAGLADDAVLATAVNLALHARALVAKDVDYLVDDGKVRLIDTTRGRVAHLRRWPDGLQEAVEVREGLTRSETGAILDQSTIPALVREYRSLAGMSGTAYGAREELDYLYRLPVVRVPANRPTVRVDEPTVVYVSAERRAAAVVERTLEAHRRGQPVLLGTQSVAESERYSQLLDAATVPHVVLNAKNDAAEAQLVAAAGRLGAVTVSTQMAGRGTDIVLGGKDGADQAPVRDSGGLLVLASGQFPSNRLDSQLRGRSGRQGDPGRTAVYAALDDHLVVAAAPDAQSLFDEGCEPDGRVAGSAAMRTVQHAQRVAEGGDLEALRATWRYHAVVAAQRAEVQVARELILTIAGDELARRVRLAVLDRRWSEHLALLADLRETIHLRVMARMNPWLSFNADAEQYFGTLIANAEHEASRLLGEHPDARDLHDFGLHRPSSTWTYVLSDLHFGTDLDRAVRSVQRALRRRPGT